MAWKWPWRRAGNANARVEEKQAVAGGFVALHAQGEAHWTRRDYATLSREGFMRNPIVHRAVRLISETASAIPWLLYEDVNELEDHPLLGLLERPNQRQAGATFFEALYGHLLLSGKDGGNLTQDQFERLKVELEQGYSGATRAGSPLLLEGVRSLGDLHDIVRFSRRGAALFMPFGSAIRST